MKSSTIIGFLIILVLILSGMVIGGEPLLFLDYPSILLVGGMLVGGNIMAFCFSLPFNAIKKLFKRKVLTTPSN